ncbi:MAG: hypothetical protein JNK67_26235 [Alphaproteobacteria bacterium]|nr:hypothetical protein [Alphaproteobacteria bacterium]
MTVFQYIRAVSDYDRLVATVRPRTGRRSRYMYALEPELVAALTASATTLAAEIGFRGWRHAEGESRSYGGISLTWNPAHQDALDPHASTLGTPRNSREAFYWSATQGHARLRDSYFDTYGFRTRTPASRHGELGRFIDGFTRTLVRSRIGIIPGADVDATDRSYLAREGWHRDEPVFENLRLNIPLVTDPNFVFQMAGEAPYHLAPGYAYTWDTHRAHRVFCAGPTRTMRIHLVLGFAPWFDWVEDEQAWRANEYFGRVHPFDMAAEGLLHPALRLARS